MTPPGPDSTTRKRIAVIAVHGVADQQPEETANTAANLLLHMQGEGAPARYHGFKTHRLRIAHRAVKLVKPAPAVPGDPSEQCQHQFLRGQLEKFEEPNPGATYETIRNEGVRVANGAEREVHIYEMYWADLSRLGNSFLTFFVELYQLLFHLSTVGAKTARFARTHHEELKSWRIFSRCIHLASHFIRLPIPIANLFVLAMIALAASAQVPTDALAVRAIAIGAFPVIGGVILAIGLRKRISALAWPYALFAVAATIAVLVWLVTNFLRSDDQISVLFYAEVWALLLGLLWQVVKAYDRRHPTARRWYFGVAGVATVLLVIFALVEVGDLLAVCDTSIAYLLHAIGLSWLVAIFAVGLAWIAGGRALASTQGKLPKARARRAVFTANLTTALTGVVMLILNVSLWGLFPMLLKKVAPIKYTVIHGIADGVQKHLEKGSFLPGMTTLLLMLAAVLWMLWALFPAVRSEMKTPPPETESSRWIGQSLTNAFRVMTWAGYLSIACFGGWLALLALLNVGKWADIHFLDDIAYLNEFDQPWAAALFSGFSAIILLFIIAPFFLKGFMTQLSAGFRQGLDVALDVINYLREHPADSTIRAQIFARYVSLLRYVCNWKSPIDGKGYDSIVIFAHSQGTVITVDLLRFLKVEPDSELGYLNQPNRIQLFTMGCPLRQLYGLRFPHIYDWARHDETKRARGAPLSKEQRPHPSRLLSVGKWVNAYRSGDYVGRNLWRSEQDDDVYDPDPKAISEDKKGTRDGEAANDEKITRREFCIGGGAHTHYWDKTAPQIVAELDRLIASA